MFELYRLEHPYGEFKRRRNILNSEELWMMIGKIENGYYYYE